MPRYERRSRFAALPCTRHGRHRFLPGCFVTVQCRWYGWHRDRIHRYPIHDRFHGSVAERLTCRPGLCYPSIVSTKTPALNTRLPDFLPGVRWNRRLAGSPRAPTQDAEAQRSAYQSIANRRAHTANPCSEVNPNPFQSLQTTSGTDHRRVYLVIRPVPEPKPCRQIRFPGKPEAATHCCLREGTGQPVRPTPVV